MTKYVALLRGIGPSNPNMHGKKLKWFFESLGFKKVQTVISSGNVIFESNSKNSKSLESKIETALPKKLGFKSTTIIRSQEELLKLANKKPFGNKKHGAKHYLTVTFFKNKPKRKLKHDRAVCMSFKPNGTPEFMVQLEKEYGKDITTRTWMTIEKILKKFES